jgi:asparagine synthase (glutamine-hydrolysing)
MESHLPHAVLYRPKMGFAVPIGRWFQGPLRARVKQALCGEVMAGSGLFDMGRMARLVDEHTGGARDHSAALWSLLVFEGFLRRTVAGSGQAARRAA